jgi:hypothetical protein
MRVRVFYASGVGSGGSQANKHQLRYFGSVNDPLCAFVRFVF